MNQKLRTREALVAAARGLVADGETPTVEMAAARADVSRTTAYRYFPSQAALLAAAHPEIVTTSLLPEDPPTDVRARVELVVARVTEVVRDTEAQQRTMLRLSLEEDRPGTDELLLRQGRVIGWLEDALSPLVDDVGRDVVRALAVAMRSVIGIESYVWLTDVARLSPADAARVMQWNAAALLEATLGGSPPPRVKRRARV